MCSVRDRSNSSRFALSAVKSRAFAIVTVLLAVGLLTTTALAFLAFVQVESSHASSMRAALLARERARLALQIAYGELCWSVGPDQRVTANAAVLGDAASLPETERWLGVWDARDPTGGPLWLVSGDTSPTRKPRNGVRIVRGGGGTPAVVVPRRTVAEGTPSPGAIAWWVSDEAQKGSLCTKPASGQGPGPATSLAVPPGVGYASLSAGAGVKVRPDFSERLLSRAQLALVDPGVAVPSLHDWTVRSYGVAENVADGGLKVNLSAPDEDADASAFAVDVRKFLERSFEDPLKVVNVAFDPPEPGRMVFAPRPIPTEIVLYVGLFHTGGNKGLEDTDERVSGDQKVRVRYHVEAEFFNPWPLPLQFATDPDSGYSRGLIIEFFNLPRVRVSEMSPNSVAPVLEESLDGLIEPASGEPKPLRLWMEFEPDPSGGEAPVLLPGEVYQALEPDPERKPDGISRHFGNRPWKKGDGTRPPDDARIRIEAEHPGAGIGIRILPYQDSDTEEDSIPLYEIRNLEFDDFEITKTFRSGPSPFSRVRSSDYTIDDYLFAYHFRIRSDIHARDSLSDLFEATDLRFPVFDADRVVDSANGSRIRLGSLLDPVHRDPSMVVLEGGLGLFSKFDVFADQTPRSHNKDYHQLLLNDLPFSQPLSLGSLSASLALQDRPIYALGAPRWTSVNAAFDRTLFSPADASGRRLHPRHQFLQAGEGAAMPDDAKRLLVTGAFNIHSQSSPAWVAALSSGITTGAGKDEGSSEQRMFREFAFFRLPFSEAARLQPGRTTGLGLPGFWASLEAMWAGASGFEQFAQGIRIVSSENEAAMMKALAQEIVASVRAHCAREGRPFLSLSEFISSGVLQEAIDRADRRSDSDGGRVDALNGGVHRFANMGLIQQDIVAHLSSFATIRGDRFLIRGYGEVTDPVDGQVRAHAACEAIVQRLPEPVVAGADPMAAASEPGRGRRFTMVSFRWLEGGQHD